MTASPRGSLAVVANRKIAGSSTFPTAVVEASGSRLRVTQMLAEHLSDVVEIESRAYDFPWSQRVFADCLSAGYSCHLIWRGPRLLGYSLVAIAAGEAHLLNICIDPLQHRHGYAGRFLTIILKIAAQLEANTVYLEVRPSNSAALALYQKFGFEKIGLRKKYYRAPRSREDAVVLSKDISDLG